MDVLIGILFAALVIGVATIAGRRLDRTRREQRDAERESSRDDAEPYGDF
jgi:hypothetical protein